MSFTLFNGAPVTEVIPKNPMVFRGGPRAHYVNPAAQNFQGGIDSEYQMVNGVYDYALTRGILARQLFQAKTDELPNAVVPITGLTRPFIAQSANVPMASTLA